MDEQVTELKQVRTIKKPRKWFPPKQGWLMCNVAFEWLKETKLMGVAWVVRNHRGVVLVHSRRAFSDITSLEEARLTTILWAIDSMVILRYKKMVFAGDFKEIFAAALKPSHWPALRFQSDELNMRLSQVEGFQLLSVSKEGNRGATIIAQSVTQQGRVRSYIARGHPRWLFELFVDKSRFL